jgi:hypothetical protein
MMPIKRRSWPALLAGLCALCLATGQVRADPLYIRGGYDIFNTVPGSGTGGSSVSVSLPAGFFGYTPEGLPSDPYNARVLLQGIDQQTSYAPTNLQILRIDHLSEFLSHFVYQQIPPYPLPDVAIRRPELVLENIGDRKTVPLQIDYLSLGSLRPLEVTYGQGQQRAFFDLFVDLPPGMSQQEGSATFTRTDDASGVVDSVLPVSARLTFTNEDPNGPQAQAQPVVDDVLHAEGTPFKVTSNPEPSTLIMFGLGGLGLLGYAWRRRRRAK